MVRIKVLHFGPIKKGLKENGGFLEIKKVTVFTGDQGAGKSILAKLISALYQLEKMLISGEIEESEVNTRSKFIKYAAVHNLAVYFRDDKRETIEFRTNVLHFKLQGGQVSIKLKKRMEYSIAKTLYVPTTRALIGVLHNGVQAGCIPAPLSTFYAEFKDAAIHYSHGITIPINNLVFEYEPINENAYVSGEDFKLAISDVSSGLQSAIPLFVVSKFMAESVEKLESGLFSDSPMACNIVRENPGIYYLNKSSDLGSFSESMKSMDSERISPIITYTSFVNIVEEPEQNLYPNSQRSILYSLLSMNNLSDQNKLLMTTHSPYLINYLTLAVKAEQVSDRLSRVADYKRIGHIMPPTPFIHGEDLVIYEFEADSGEITRLSTYHGVPSDDHQLNIALGEFNDMYASLLTLQHLN